MFILLLFASLPDCGQNQTAVSDEQYLLSDFYPWITRPGSSNTKDKPIQISPPPLVQYHIRYCPAEAVSGLYVELQHVTDTGQKSDRQKVAMRPNGWLYKIILPARSLILISNFYLGTILMQFHPPANVTPDFQKRNKKEIHFQNA